MKYDYDKNEVLSTNPDLIKAIEISQKINRVIEPLAIFIYNYRNRVAKLKEFTQYTYRTDMVHHAMHLSIQGIMNFDVRKSNNPCLYIDTLCRSGVVNYIIK